MNDLDEQIKDLLTRSVALTPPGPVDMSTQEATSNGRTRVVAAVASAVAVGIAVFGVLMVSRSGSTESVMSDSSTTREAPIAPEPVASDLPLTAQPAESTTTSSTEPPAPTARPPETLPIEAFEGLIPPQCLNVTPSAGPTNSVPLFVDLDGIPGPVDETGFEIGPHELDLEPFDPRTAQNWVPVADETTAATIGYLHVPLAETDTVPESQDPMCHPEVAIFDENGVLIGTFIDGQPVIAPTGPPGL